jgi:hypothetical protein
VLTYLKNTNNEFLIAICNEDSCSYSNLFYSLTDQLAKGLSNQGCVDQGAFIKVNEYLFYLKAADIKQIEKYV